MAVFGARAGRGCNGGDEKEEQGSKGEDANQIGVEVNIEVEGPSAGGSETGTGSRAGSVRSGSSGCGTRSAGRKSIRSTRTEREESVGVSDGSAAPVGEPVAEQESNGSLAGQREESDGNSAAQERA